MASDKHSKPSTIIKKYANRRLYHTGTSAYVTLDDLANMVRRGEEFVVQDAKTGEDITRGVLGQIIFDAESRGSGLLPISFLRQLITFYGGQMQSLVPPYLDHALSSFSREQEQLRRQVNDALGTQASVVEEQVRRNMELFQRSMRMFMPFGRDDDERPPEPPAAPDRSDTNGAQGSQHLREDLEALRDELARMHARLDALAAPRAVETPPEPERVRGAPTCEAVPSAPAQEPAGPTAQSAGKRAD